MFVDDFDEAPFETRLRLSLDERLQRPRGEHRHVGLVFVVAHVRRAQGGHDVGVPAQHPQPERAPVHGVHGSHDPVLPVGTAAHAGDENEGHQPRHRERAFEVHPFGIFARTFVVGAVTLATLPTGR